MSRVEKISPVKTKTSTLYPMVSSKNKCRLEYFIVGLEKKDDVKASAVTTKPIHTELKDVCTGIDCFKRDFFIADERQSHSTWHKHHFRCLKMN